MLNPYSEKGFVLQESQYKDLEVYRKESSALFVMKKFKDDKKAFRKAGNHLDGDMGRELITAFTSLQREEDCKAVILTSGHRVAFSRGARIEALLGATAQQTREFIKGAQQLVLAIQACPLPVVAAINGLTFGGGLELAMACDYRICSTRENVVFGMPEASLGLIPGMGGTANLPRLVGPQLAMDIISKARIDIFPDTAKECGLVDLLVPEEELIEEAFRWGQKEDLRKRVPGLTQAPEITSEAIAEEIQRYLGERKKNGFARGEGGAAFANSA